MSNGEILSNVCTAAHPVDCSNKLESYAIQGPQLQADLCSAGTASLEPRIEVNDPSAYQEAPQLVVQRISDAEAVQRVVDFSGMKSVAQAETSQEQSMKQGRSDEISLDNFLAHSGLDSPSVETLGKEYTANMYYQRTKVPGPKLEAAAHDTTATSKAPSPDISSSAVSLSRKALQSGNAHVENCFNYDHLPANSGPTRGADQVNDTSSSTSAGFMARECGLLQLPNNR